MALRLRSDYIRGMETAVIIATLKQHETEFRSLGVESLSIFGSTARGEATEQSDVDIAVKLDYSRMPTGFSCVGRLEELRERLEETLGRHVDVVTEPTRKPSLQNEINRDRKLAF